MKIIDRYVLATFIKNYLIAFFVLIGMYIALDMVFNFANLTQNKGEVGDLSLFQVVYDIANFYFYQSFVFFVQLSGIIAVLAAAFTFMRLSRFNEMTALLAAGTPLLRVAMSVVVAGVVLNLVLLPIDQELIIPVLIPKLVRDHSDVHQTTTKNFPVHMMRDNHGSLLSAAMYTPRTAHASATIEQLDVIDRDKDLNPISHLYATQAIWNPNLQQWDLVDGWRVPIQRPTAAGDKTLPHPESVYKTEITPQEIALNLGKDYIQLLSTATINQLLDMKRYGTIDLLRTKHLRFAQPICNVILLLVAIATVLTREPGTLKAALMKCLMICSLCMGSVFITYQLAASPPSPEMLNFWPALMAWIPIFIFGPLAVYLLDRVKS